MDVPEEEDAPEAILPERLAGDIEFDGVSFTCACALYARETRIPDTALSISAFISP